MDLRRCRSAADGPTGFSSLTWPLLTAPGPILPDRGTTRRMIAPAGRAVVRFRT